VRVSGKMEMTEASSRLPIAYQEPFIPISLHSRSREQRSDAAVMRERTTECCCRPTTLSSRAQPKSKYARRFKSGPNPFHSRDDGRRALRLSGRRKPKPFASK